MKYIIIGCGRMGEGLARTMSLRGHEITVMDKDPAPLEHLNHAFTGKSIVGSSFDREVLLLAGIEKADGLAAVTNSDEANLIVARLARVVFHVPRVVARLYDPHKAEAYRRLDVQVVATSSWAIHRFADLLSYSELDAVMSLGGGEVEIVEAEVPSLLVGHKVNAIDVPGEARIIGLTRRGKAFLPFSETVLHKDDVMHIAVLTTSIERLRAILSSG